MRKARLILAALAILPIVGSALAFKAKNAYGRNIWKAPSAGAPATILVISYTLEVVSGTPTITGFYTSRQNDLGVPTTAYFYN